MSKQDRQRAAAERLWCERFGQPPPIRTDAELMMRVLESLGGPRTRPALADDCHDKGGF